MQSKRESAIVGLFVLIAFAVLFATVFAMSGAFGRSTTKFHAYFPFAGGLEPGATVRYAGGPKVGRVDSVRLDPQNPALLDITFSVPSDLPVKTDSSVKILSLSPLGDNHVEILPGSAQAPRAPSGALLASQKYVDFNALAEQLNDLNPQAQQLLRNLNDRASEVKETIARVNDLLSPQNRENLAATLANARGLIEENRPQIKTTLQNVNAVSEKLQPLLEDFRKTSAEANQALDHIDAMVGGSRVAPDTYQYDGRERPA
jgi:phospholipid/cholesterol/gamma-HCH transport system substrate-binding protein